MKHPTHNKTAPKPPAEIKPTASSVKKDNGPVASVATLDMGQQDGPRDELIRQTAYFLYESRSYQSGHDLDDWLQAEAQIANPTLRGSQADL